MVLCLKEMNQGPSMHAGDILLGCSLRLGIADWQFWPPVRDRTPAALLMYVDC